MEEDRKRKLLTTFQDLDTYKRSKIDENPFGSNGFFSNNSNNGNSPDTYGQVGALKDYGIKHGEEKTLENLINCNTEVLSQLSAQIEKDPTQENPDLIIAFQTNFKRILSMIDSEDMLPLSVQVSQANLIGSERKVQKKDGTEDVTISNKFGISHKDSEDLRNILLKKG
eukprot:TRINITY_DN6295_c0_g1_i1.p1 TRINITY_DN6295_c0_g1~~TRINITY_DN6295_c0_g1_i1.p1  ORF type:complete len:169 (-),score=68.72 TRINITY_DN6295_c0_g1_i1:128-634(-)